MKKVFRLLPLFIFSLLIFSCGQSPKEEVNEAELLVGKWELSRSEMNGQDATERMEGTFFHFANKSELLTNFNPEGEPERYAYQLSEEDGEVSVQGGFNPVFSTRFDGEDRLTLVTSINRNKFTFMLHRASQDAPLDVDTPPGGEDSLDM